MIDQRIIPNVTEPYEGYTNASLRRMMVGLRQENHRLRQVIEKAVARLQKDAAGAECATQRRLNTLAILVEALENREGQK